MGLLSHLLFCAVTSLLLPLKVELEDYPNARCNDGSTAVYYFKAGSDPYLWLVNLQGGGWCWNDQMCTARCQHLARGGFCGSNSVEGGFLDQLEVGGIFEEREDNPLKNANKVFVKYCSPDAWMGRAESGPSDMIFKGSYIVEAVFEDLVSRFDLGVDKTHQTTVVFGGQSAGARGAMVNLDHIHDIYASNSDLNVNVVGWLDSPLWLPMNSPELTTLSYIGQTKSVYDYANNMEILRQDCLDEYPDTPFFCMFGYYTLPFVKTRSVLVSALYDTHQLSDEDLAGYEYAETFANAMAEAMLTLAEENPNLYIFGPACCNHAESRNDAFFDMQYSSTSQATMLSRLLSSSSDNFAVVDGCASGMTNDVCCGDVGIVGNTCTALVNAPTEKETTAIPTKDPTPSSPTAGPTTTAIPTKDPTPSSPTKAPTTTAIPTQDPTPSSPTGKPSAASKTKVIFNTCDENSAESNQKVTVSSNGQQFRKTMRRNKVYEFVFDGEPADVEVRKRGSDGLCISSVTQNGVTITNSAFWLDDPCTNDLTHRCKGASITLPEKPGTKVIINTCDEKFAESNQKVTVSSNGQQFRKTMRRNKVYEFVFEGEPADVEVRKRGSDGLCISSVTQAGVTITNSEFWLDDPCNSDLTHRCEGASITLPEKKALEDDESDNDRACLKDFAFHDGHMLKDINTFLTGGSAKWCQSQCKALSGCKYWDYGQNFCRMRSNKGSRGAISSRGYFGGQRDCSWTSEASMAFLSASKISPVLYFLALIGVVSVSYSVFHYASKRTSFLPIPVEEEV